MISRPWDMLTGTADNMVVSVLVLGGVLIPTIFKFQVCLVLYPKMQVLWYALE